MSRFGYKNRKEVEELVKNLTKYDIPCSVIHIDPFWMKREHYCDLEWNTRTFPEPEEMMKNSSNCKRVKRINPTGFTERIMLYMFI